MTALALLLFVLAGPVLVGSAYMGFLAVIAKRLPPQEPASSGDAGLLRFDVIIPAHNEAETIADVIKSIDAVDYPRELRRTVVVADNCTDATAQVAAAEGAVVLTRIEPERRGKGYALALAFRQSIEDGFADATAVVDADTVVSANMLREFSRRISAGADAVQAEYSVRNPEASWRTRLMRIALSLFHLMRSLARERLGLSAGLRGNGMGFSIGLLRRAPYDAYSLVEDVEYGIKLGEAGCRVAFVQEAKVFGEMVPREDASRSQRRRWEGGRAALARARGLSLLKEGLARRSPMLLDLAMDVLLPPLSTMVLVTLAGCAATLAGVAAAGMPASVAAPWLMSAGLLILYVLRGWQLSETGLRGLAALSWAPVYVLWKIGLMIAGGVRGERGWIRTTRVRASHD